MQYHIPTVHELMRKSKRELRAIFKASMSTSIVSSSPTERSAATRTVVTVKIVLRIPGLH